MSIKTYNNDLYSPWIKMDISKWEPLTKGRKVTQYCKKSMLFSQDDHQSYLYIVENGRVRVTSYQEDGSEKQVYIAEKGALCGEVSCVIDKPYYASAMAIVDSLIYVIPWSEAKEIIATNRELNDTFMQYLARFNMVMLRHVIELSFSQSEQRIAQLLIFVAKQYGIPKSGGLGISIKFTHQDVASMINTSRVTVSNIFNQLIDRKIITKKDGYFVILDLEVLEEIANGAGKQG